MGLWRAVIRRSWADRPFMVAVWLLLASATTLIAAGSLYTDTVEIGGLRQAVQAAAPADQAVSVRLSAKPAEVLPFDALIKPDLAAVFGAVGGEVDLTVRSSSLTPVGPASPDAAKHLTMFSGDEGVEQHATLVSGRWAAAGQTPIEATLSDAAAKELGLGVGDRVDLADAADPLADPTVAVASVVVTGIWHLDRADPYWLGDPLELDGIVTNPTTTVRGPFVVAPSDVLGSAAFKDVDVLWRAIPDVDQLRVDRLPPLRNAIAALPGAVKRILPPDRFVTVSTGLGSVLADLDRSILVSRSGVIILTLQFGVLAGYAVLLVGGMLAERRRPEIGLLRARGASSWHIAALAVGEALLLAVPAAAAAPFLALGVVRLLGGIGPLADTGLVSTVAIGDSTVIAAVLAGAACAVALSLPALGSSADLARIRAALGRPFSQTFAQRLGIDVVLLILAGIGLWQLRLYGAPLTRDAQGTLGLDPLLVAAPAFGLAAGAVLATRFVPRLAEIGERTLHRRRGVVAPLGARQLARRPLRYTRTALLLMLAAALGTFAVVYAATWTRSQADQAAYQAGADVRVVATDYPTLPTWAIGPTLRAIDGVQAAVPVSTQSFEVPHVLTDGQLVAFDPTDAAPVMDLPVDASPTGLSSGLDALVAGRPPVVSTPIEAAAKRLSVRIDAAIQGQQEFIGGATAPDFPGIRLAIVVQDADGRLHRFAGDATAPITASGQRIEVPLTMTTDGVELTAAPPLWVVGLEITVVPDKDSGDWGTIDIQGIDSSLSTSGDDWTPTSFDASADGLAWSKVLGDNFQIGVSGIRLTVGSDTAPVLGVGLSDTPTGIFLLTTAHADAPLRVVASDVFMAETKAQIGDIVSATSRFADLQVKVVATTPTFPTLGPATPFLIADGPTLAMDRYEARDELDAADQWLLRVDDARSQSVGDAVLQAPISAKQAIVRTTLTHSLEGDPVALGVVGGLGLGALAAIAFAIVGFLVGAVVATRERLGEFALLRGLGLSRRQLFAGLTIENVFLLATGMAAGSGLGLLLAGLVLPFATLDATGAPVVPAPIVVVPWDAIGLTYVFAAGLAVVVVFLAGRQVDARSITAVLRARDE